MNEKLRGVNLGGWLVLEKWITPSLFAHTDAIDEYTLMRQPSSAKRMKQHRQTFITENDFKWFVKNNINLIRIPIGYWLFERVDGFTPTVVYLDQAMTWATKYKIHVLIDLHAARGSQNGKDHSGKVGQARWYDNQRYQEETIKLLCLIADRYEDSPALWGIELLNEPLAKEHYFTLLRFYRRAYKLLRKVLRPETYILFHDGFRPLSSAGILRRRKSHPVMMDVHWYAFISKSDDAATYLSRTAFFRRILLSFLQLHQPIIIGEWSLVMPQQFLATLPAELRLALLKKYAEVQIQAYNNAAGWIYWTYKTEDGGVWSFRDMVDHGVIKFSK